MKISHDLYDLREILQFELERELAVTSKYTLLNELHF